MRKAILAGIGLLVAGTASAADLPRRPPPPPPPQKVYVPRAFDWTGFYLGGQLGGGFAGSQFFDPVRRRAGRL